jgi:pimeloyl-ACP methyl ester carboxylesterase
MNRAAGSTVRFLSGPPFGAALFRHVAARLGAGGAACIVDPAFPAEGWSERADHLADDIRADSDTVLVAHGLAVPAAIAASLRAPPRALVLSNGPVTRLDPFTRALGGLAARPGGRALLARGVLAPRPWLRWLASSAGLRRAAVNPYVMDRDTVALLCGPLVASVEARQATASYLASLAAGLPDARSLRCPVLLVWGDADPLYPASEACFVEAGLPGARHVTVPGGQHVHPEERPWELADAIGAWLPDQGHRDQGATSVS